MTMKRAGLGVCLVLLIFGTSAITYAQEGPSKKGRLSVFGGLGISGARGDYPSEYDARPEFSFFPGLRLRLDDLFFPGTVILADMGYLETGYVGYVVATDTYFYNTYEYINIDVMFGTKTALLYAAAGLYFGSGIEAYSYREYTDETVSYNANDDIGLVGEIGIDPLSFISLGVQGRFGLKSIGTTVDTRNWGLLATIGLHFLRF